MYAITPTNVRKTDVSPNWRERASVYDFWNYDSRTRLCNRSNGSFVIDLYNGRYIHIYVDRIARHVRHSDTSRTSLIAFPICRAEGTDEKRLTAEGGTKLRGTKTISPPIDTGGRGGPPSENIVYATCMYARRRWRERGEGILAIIQCDHGTRIDKTPFRFLPARRPRLLAV